MNKSETELFKDYQQIHEKFFQKMCSGGTEEQYWKIVKNYKGNGNFVPLLPDNSLDKQSIRHHFHHFGEKISWIEKSIARLKKENEFKKKMNSVEQLRNFLDDLVELKRRYYEANDIKSKTTIRIQSSEKYGAFQQAFGKLMEEVYFLKSYNFPVDHFQLRKEYDSFKEREDKAGKQKSNQIYFYRKITEDGAYNPDLSGSDLFLRATLSMIANRLSSSADFLVEEIRYDLDTALQFVEKHIKKGSHVQIQRLKEWKGRVKRRRDFYLGLLEDKVKIDGAYNTTDEYVRAKSLARSELREYIYQMQLKTFNFWAAQPEIMRYLYVMDTIMYNEVGAIDGRDALERRDVAKVVLNRSEIEFYSTLSPKGPLSDLFNQYDDLSRYKWLNILFKEGEFSFTYYFIPATVRVFCPDQTRIGRYLRRENVKLALEYLNEDISDFPAVRYFSRASMMGRINMAKLWQGFAPIPERPGKKEPSSHFLRPFLSSNRYRYHYHFTDPGGETYKVVEIRGKTYVVSLDGRDIYRYRDPNLFRYFKKL